MAKVLIIDDDSSVRDYLARLVTRLGHSVVTAKSCSEGHIQMRQPSVDVIIADIFLPDSPPLEKWVDQLKAASNHRPLILITGEPSELVSAQARGGEVKALLTKPFELAFIKNLLAEVAGTVPTQQ